MVKNQSGIIPIEKFNQGGLSQSKWSGIKNSLYKMIGFDPHSLPGILLVEQKLTAESATAVPDELCKVAVNCSNGSQYWFSSESGNIWEKFGDEKYRLVYTTPPSRSQSASLSPSASNSMSVSPSVSTSPSTSVSPSTSTSLSPSASISPSASASLSTSFSPSASGSKSISPSSSQSPSASRSPSSSSSTSISPSPSSAEILSKCLGAAEYQGFIYWATESFLHRIAVSLAANNNWNTDADVDGWPKEFSITDTDFHPMYAHPSQQILYIGDGNYIAQVDAGTFTANALDIATPLRVKSLGQIGTDLLIGTYVADTVTKTEIIRWNGWSVSFTSSDPIPEIGINAFLSADNFVLVQAGNKGNIYYYNGTQLELYGKIPGNYSSTAYGEVNPYSVGNREGQILFGFSNGLGNPADEGIYRIARHDKNYPYITDFPYPISERSGGEFVLSGLTIGALLVVGSDIYVSWKHGSTCGIDKLDASNKLDGAYIETRVATINRESLANFSKAIIAYALLPSETDINFYTDINYAGYGDVLTKVNDTQRNIVETKDCATEFTTIQLKVKITANSNDAPQIESGGIFLGS